MKRERAPIPLQDWVQQMQQVSGELSRGALKFESSRVLRLPASKKEGVGSYISVLSAFDSMHLGLVASSAGCRVLARGLIHAPVDEEMSDSEVVDGVNELVNILAGKVKARMVGRDGTLRLGLPMFLTSPVRLTERMEVAEGVAEFGPVECRLMVFRNRRAA
jgi:hypothetical protein